MKYYIIAGEASGDLHGSNLIKALKKKDKNPEFRIWGGDLMKEVAGMPVKHIKELAFMGFKEVLLNIRTIKKNFDLCYNDIIDFKPDVLILIDYPGFNLRVAKFAKENKIPVCYYISPQIWAWKQSRIKKIKQYVDKMLVILPFEKEFYKKFNYDVDFVGHPLMDSISQAIENNVNDLIQKYELPDRKIIALLPGSRKQEISKKLPVMMEVAKKFDIDFQVIIAGSSNIELEYYEKFLDNNKYPVIFGETYKILMNSHAAMVTSGTATLETALFEVPQVVCYKSGYLSYLIAKQLVKVKYISLVNLIMDKAIVVELIQNDFNPISLYNEFKKLLYDENYRNKIIADYKKLKSILGGKGASVRAAELIMKYFDGNE
ncbi:MAG: lipid-A-disaccharide synthase [Marinilabiliales bacterium]